MAFGAKVKIEGADALKKSLETLPGKLQRKVMKKALRAAAKPILAETKTNAPVDTRRLKRAFGVRNLKTRRRGLVGVKITSGVKGPHAHLVELGTQERRHKSGKSTGKVEAMNFMGKAADSKKEEAVQIFSAVLGPAIEMEAKRGS